LRLRHQGFAVPAQNRSQCKGARPGTLAGSFKHSANAFRRASDTARRRYYSKSAFKVNTFSVHNGILHAENIPLDKLAAEFGTPLYVYSHAALTASFKAFEAGCAGRDHLICYAMKANSNLAILNLFARLGSGFDIVSGGELARVIAAGGDPKKTVFSGIGKSAAEMRAALEAGILCFNVESAAELERLNDVAQSMGKRAPVSLRVNPDVDAKTHPYISTGLKESKFGIAFEDAISVYLDAAAMPGISVQGIDCHIGSQLTETTPFVDALDKVLDLIDELARHDIHLHHIDLGGGLGIRYQDETPPTVGDYLARLFKRLDQRLHTHPGSRPVKILFEPGRWMVGNAGLLLTRVEYLKHNDAKNFAIIDAAMNDLVRPALYDAFHDIIPVTKRVGITRSYDVVGPVCESGDFLGRNRELALESGDLLAVMSAGAYGMSMASNYNTRPRAAEVMVDGDHAHLIREREKTENLYSGEHLLP
jgi:diaminopimelate decarboxylase